MIIKHCFTALVDDLGLIMIVTKIEIYKITLLILSLRFFAVSFKSSFHNY